MLNNILLYKMGDNLLDLTNKLKSGLATNKQTITDNNTELIEKMKAMNILTQSILEKVGNFTTNSQTLQRNIEMQATQIRDLTRQLEETKQEHSAAQSQIQQIQSDLATAQGKGEEAGVLKQQLTDLQAEASISREKIDSLTSQISQTTQTIQEILGSINSEQEITNHQELKTLVDTLKKHIDDINERMPGESSRKPLTNTTHLRLQNPANISDNTSDVQQELPNGQQLQEIIRIFSNPEPSAEKDNYISANPQFRDFLINWRERQGMANVNVESPRTPTTHPRRLELESVSENPLNTPYVEEEQPDPQELRDIIRIFSNPEPSAEKDNYISANPQFRNFLIDFQANQNMSKGGRLKKITKRRKLKRRTKRRTGKRKNKKTCKK